MKRLTTLTACVVVAGVAAAAAQAKGPSRATITGPGLAHAIVLSGNAENGGGSLFMRLVQDGGFFPAMYGESPDPTLRHRPTGTLGPRYLVAYRVPGSNAAVGRVRQVLYPFAKPVPVTYTPAGQTFWGGKTYGGWIQAPSSFRQTLIAIGVPAPR